MPNPLIPIQKDDNKGLLLVSGGDVCFELECREGDVYFVISNIGDKAVKNIKIKFDVELPVILDEISTNTWNNSSLCKESIGTLGPGKSIDSFTGTLSQWLNQKIALLKFTVIVSYHGKNGDRFTEQFPQNLAWFRNWVLKIKR